MKLYKNVDLCDLDRILSEGILPIRATGNNNWSNKKRANNSTNLVYLFVPKSNVNAFPEYGIVLLEVLTEATRSEIIHGDIHTDDYDEYVVDKVSADKIRNVYIPDIFRSRIEEMKLIAADRITYVPMNAYEKSTVFRTIC